MSVVAKAGGGGGESLLVGAATASCPMCVSARGFSLPKPLAQNQGEAGSWGPATLS